MVSRLRYAPGLAAASAVWPFEVSAPELPAGRGAVIHAEVWPSLIDVPVVTGQVRDQTQVMCLARELRNRDRAGTLTAVFTAAPRRAGSEEGWILGV